ncbi:2-oxoglutarate dehydrogenase, E2 component, dihydrolipoamide succinyltransferase [Corynebacterium halotolerans]|uniref:Dihydrolipoamide acetyltransferase component of pyruvate dehydrogenase complex n=1 Tax=Corynebacterium halotolerans YIM 70093 = DSM 44683 TaxID=1121362 RepID=M1P8E4_9CORY|nr:2-oxoglutarate dehydrogenase, E2 component, dihydrolipoamide succinyltransferase [Corynebacterium halotolerans]AGF72936.1 pyruvate dehydrogenase dihydrolipoyltransacetylase [Corynebacterium halotolerans YIM 70093 = DSM 44683]
MAFSVEMPELGESVTEGTITQWLKSVGDTVEVDEPLLEVSTDKVDTEIPSPAAGVLLEIKAEEDDTVDVGAVIATIGEEGESAGDSDSSDDEVNENAEQVDPSGGQDVAQVDPAQDSSEKATEAKGSSTDVEMPELGESVTEGTITQWLKSVGDTVEVDEPLLEVSTDKVDTEIPSPVAGTLQEILAEEDDTVDVGAIIARIGSGEAPQAEEKEEDREVPSEEAIQESESKDEKDTVEEAQEPESDDSGSADSADATDVEMPELGESVTEGTITQWLKSVGDTVEVDEPLLEVSTDKVDTEIPSPVAGTLQEILAEEDDTVDVGAIIARIGSGEAPKKKEAPKKEEPKAEPKKEAKPEKKEEPKKEAPKAEPIGRSPGDSSESEGKGAPKQESGKKVNNDNVPYVTPLVRKLADKHGVDLNTVEGTGVGGRIRKQDVLAAAEGGAEGKDEKAAPKGERANWSTKSVDPAKAELIGTTQKVNRIREITAAKMVESLQTSAQLTHVQEVDMTRVAELRKANKQAFVDKHGANPTYLVFIVKAVAEALVSHPNVNASYNAETKEMTYHADVNIGIAVDTPQGLLVPVIKKAQDLSLPEIAKEIVDLAERARNKKLRPDDLSGGTFTVTNIGSEGALLDTPVLTPPQAGILGTAAIEKRPVVVTDEGVDSIAIRQMAYLPFTYDHQVVDGADAGRFITTIKDRLETADFESDLQL